VREWSRQFDPNQNTCTQFENNYFTEMCSGSETGSYLRLIDFVYQSTLGLRVIKKKKMPILERHMAAGVVAPRVSHLVHMGGRVVFPSFIQTKIRICRGGDTYEIRIFRGRNTCISWRRHIYRVIHLVHVGEGALVLPVELRFQGRLHRRLLHHHLPRER